MFYHIQPTDMALPEPRPVPAEWPKDPGYTTLADFIRPMLDGGWLERVAVHFNPAEPDGRHGPLRPCDMFVDEEGAVKSLPLNPLATAIYHSVSLRRGVPPGQLSPICGPAVVFTGRVWF